MAIGGRIRKACSATPRLQAIICTVLVAKPGALWHILTHSELVLLVAQAIRYTNKASVLSAPCAYASKEEGFPMGRCEQRETTGSAVRRPCFILNLVLTGLHTKVARGRVSYHEMQAAAYEE